MWPQEWLPIVNKILADMTKEKYKRLLTDIINHRQYKERLMAFNPDLELLERCKKELEDLK